MDRVRNHRNLSTKKRFREVCFQPLKEIFLLAARSVCVHTFLKTTQPSQKNCPSFLLRVFKLIIDHWYELSLNTQKKNSTSISPIRTKEAGSTTSLSLYLIIPFWYALAGGISGEFGRAMFRILARRSRARIPMARPNEPDMPPKRTKKVRLGIYRTQIQPKI